MKIIHSTLTQLLKILGFLFFPLRDFFEFLHNKKQNKYSTVPIAKFFISFSLGCIIWAASYAVILPFSYQIAMAQGFQLGFVSIPVLISGTGSMYPSFPKIDSDIYAEQSQIVASPYMRSFPGGLNIFGQEYLKYQLNHGDIVSFSNEKTSKLITEMGGDPNLTTGFVKRVVALPGDTIELRNGYLFRNGSRVIEPYLARSRSTFGGTTLQECKEYRIPDHQVAVFGDNRKASNDSRHDLGLVALEEIEQVLPVSDQDELSKSWIISDNEESSDTQPILEVDQYVEFINEIRTQNDVKPLSQNTKLSIASSYRAEAILLSGDFSFEATSSGLSMEQAMRKAGYSNITWGELPVQGYYSAEELIDVINAIPSYKEFLMKSEYQDIGVSVVAGELNGCPTQLVVHHLAGYVPPEYTQEEIESWRIVVEDLNILLSGWIQARSSGAFYEEHKAEYELIISKIQERVQIAEHILRKLENYQWLNDEDEAFLERYKQLSEEHQVLASELNEKARNW